MNRCDDSLACNYISFENKFQIKLQSINNKIENIFSGLRDLNLTKSSYKPVSSKYNYKTMQYLADRCLIIPRSVNDTIYISIVTGETVELQWTDKIKRISLEYIGYIEDMYILNYVYRFMDLYKEYPEMEYSYIVLGTYPLADLKYPFKRKEHQNYLCHDYGDDPLNPQNKKTNFLRLGFKENNPNMSPIIDPPYITDDISSPLEAEFNILIPLILNSSSEIQFEGSAGMKFKVRKFFAFLNIDKPTINGNTFVMDKNGYVILATDETYQQLFGSNWQLMKKVPIYTSPTEFNQLYEFCYNKLGSSLCKQENIS